ncbi:hypothetical protein ASPFODRAFT_49861 [Aspergillus luchuensis CBS 106.47]|uniref:Exonuclease domain-containing protein n=1 Tax=Aspergillus luchuensis (strain CBS 106.47) TaxID=1137211 RepID=A0A1M3T8Y3_ASPLC|nr:hypothetical protein ASPFODRAFT_49861 [Aspergillus luchuensis CBS 106.47]
MPKCCFMSCPRPQDALSKYCDTHSTALIEYVATHKSWLPTTVEWTPCPTPDTKIELQLLKDWHTHSPKDVWIVDFEFVTVGGTASPIPVQLAIRQIDGVLLLETNVDYCLSFDEFSENIGPLRTERYLVPQILQRCYGSGPRTNGLAPTEIRARIYDLGYDPGKTKILSWFSVQDMQCFQRILLQGNDVIVPKEGHQTCKNFQEVDLGMLCKRLLPHSWPSLKLVTVHGSIMAKQGQRVDSDLYHNASGDTAAVVDIVKELLSLV